MKESTRQKFYRLAAYAKANGMTSDIAAKGSFQGFYCLILGRIPGGDDSTLFMYLMSSAYHGSHIDLAGCNDADPTDLLKKFGLDKIKVNQD